MGQKNNNKIAELRIKVFPLILSILMHICVLLIFIAIHFNRENVFTVKLIPHALHINLQSEPERITVHTDSISTGKLHRLRQNEYEQVETKAPTMINSEQDISPMDDNQSLLNTLDHTNSNKRGEDTGYRNVSLIMEPSGYGKGRSQSGLNEKGIYNTNDKSGGLGKEVIKSEFGSLNGPSFLKMVRPEYPFQARKLGKEGRVVLKLFIDEHGGLMSIETVERAGYGFDEAAIKAVKVSTFIPAKINGKPITCSALLPVRFKLSSEN